MQAIDIDPAIRGRIFLGSLEAARQLDLLESSGITHIVCFLGKEYEAHKAIGRFHYWSHEVPEKESEAIGELFAPVAAFVDAALASAPESKVLFHCRSGEHRSATVLTAYLMQRTRRPALEVAQQVQHIRCPVEICPPYARALLAYQAALGVGARPAAAPAPAAGIRDELAPSAVPAMDVAAELDLEALLAADPTAARARGTASPPSDRAAFLNDQADALRIIDEVGYEAVAANLTCPMSRIAPRLFLGMQTGAFSRAALQASGITHVVSMLGPASVRFPGWLHYRVFELGDAPEYADQLLACLPEALRFVREALASKPRLPPRPAAGGAEATAAEVLSEEDAKALLPSETAVLIHCQAGASRSATVMTAFLMQLAGLRARDALRYVQKRRPVARPIVGFRKVLLTWEEHLFNPDVGASASEKPAVGGAGEMPASVAALEDN